MAVRIVSVDLETNYAWQDLRVLNDWSVIKNSNASWNSILHTSKTGQVVKVEVEVTEGTWGSVNELLSTWEFVKNKFADWSSLKNW